MHDASGTITKFPTRASRSGVRDSQGPLTNPQGVSDLPQLLQVHMGLHSRIPVLADGIRIEGKNPALTAIQNAAKDERSVRPSHRPELC